MSRANSEGRAVSAQAWSLTRRRPQRFAPGALPREPAAKLRAALMAEHARDPFTPGSARSSSHRVVSISRTLGLTTDVIRGGVDVGGAELDHVWTVVEGHVVDVTLPILSDTFVRVLRAFIAGDVDASTLDRIAHGYALQWRVLGEFPEDYGYVGLPVLDRRGDG